MKNKGFRRFPLENTMRERRERRNLTFPLFPTDAENWERGNTGKTRPFPVFPMFPPPKTNIGEFLPARILVSNRRR